VPFAKWDSTQMDRAIIASITVAILLGVSACNDPARLDERGPTVWFVDGKKVQIDRTYFRAQGERLAFAVEWTCLDCGFDKTMSQGEALAVSRPVLWYAVESGESGRTAVTKLGSGRLQTNRLISIVAYQVAGKPEQTTISVDKLDDLFDWTWVLGGRSYHVFRPGYYFDLNTGRVYFTIKWHDTQLCDKIAGITDERARDLAMPVMKEIVLRKLFRFIPRSGVPIDRAELNTRELEAIGVEIGCPEPACAGAVDCPARGYRVSRTLAQIEAAP